MTEERLIGYSRTKTAPWCWERKWISALRHRGRFTRRARAHMAARAYREKTVRGACSRVEKTRLNSRRPFPRPRSRSLWWTARSFEEPETRCAGAPLGHIKKLPEEFPSQARHLPGLDKEAANGCRTGRREQQESIKQLCEELFHDEPYAYPDGKDSFGSAPSGVKALRVPMPIFERTREEGLNPFPDSHTKLYRFPHLSAQCVLDLCAFRVFVTRAKPCRSIPHD
jgi:hypothetical protein